MVGTGKFPGSVIRSIDASKILGIRAGDDHRFIGIWVVVVDDRVFVRSWDNKATGWYQTFCKNPEGSIQVGNRKFNVRARKTRGERLLDSIGAAYAQKYNTKAS